MQKYLVVSFINPENVSDTFSAANWPLHCTLLPNFSTEALPEDVILAVSKVATSHQQIIVEIGEEALFGPDANFPVSLVLPTQQVLEFHTSLTSRLEPLHITYDNPQFVHEGYRPHITIQENARVHQGNFLTIKTISLIDMIPDGDTTRRKVIKSFELSHD